MNTKRQLTRLLGTAGYPLVTQGVQLNPKPVPAPIHLKGPEDVLRLLEEQVNAVRAAPLARPLSKARLLAQLTTAALKAMEVGQLAARLEMLEAVLKQRHREDRTT